MASGMKRLAKETAVYGMSSIIGRFLNWMLVPIYTRVFTNTGDFGIVTNLYGWVALLLVLLTCGMETGFFRFVNKKEEKEPMRIYVTTLAWIGALAVGFILFSLLLLRPIAGLISYTAPLEFLGMMLVITAVSHSGGYDIEICRAGLPFCWNQVAEYLLEHLLECILLTAMSLVIQPLSCKRRLVFPP